MTEILFAEDDADIRKWVAVALESEGYQVRTVNDGEEAVAAYNIKHPDLLLLDVMMPRRDGFSVCEEIRTRDPSLPILMLTARDTEKDKVAGLSIGADDYMTKPFGMQELFARIAALLRRSRLVAQPISKVSLSFRIGTHTIDGNKLVVRSKDGIEESLALREYELLKLLNSHPGEVLRRDRILNEIWGYTFYGNTRTLDQHIALVRKKLGEDGVCIETIRNVGYKLLT